MSFCSVRFLDAAVLPAFDLCMELFRKFDRALFSYVSDVIRVETDNIKAETRCQLIAQIGFIIILSYASAFYPSVSIHTMSAPLSSLTRHRHYSV